jgi:hypothetical protein
MAATRRFYSITESMWDCIKAASAREHGTVHTTGVRGSATTDTPAGQIIVAFDFDVSAQTIEYTIVKKPMFVGEKLIWDSIEKIYIMESQKLTCNQP